MQFSLQSLYLANEERTIQSYAARFDSEPEKVLPLLVFSYSAWRRSVNGLGEHLQAWVRYCYGYDLIFRYQRLMFQHVWEQFQHQHSGKKIQGRVTKKLIELVWLAAQEVAASRNNDTYQEYAGAALARMVSVERSTWLRVYSAHWVAIKASFAEMDSQALSEILSRYEEYQELKVAEI